MYTFLVVSDDLMCRGKRIKLLSHGRSWQFLAALVFTTLSVSIRELFLGSWVTSNPW